MFEKLKKSKAAFYIKQYAKFFGFCFNYSPVLACDTKVRSIFN